MKQERIYIRVSELEKQAIKDAADKMQMTVSEYLLYLFRKEPKNQILDTKFLLSKILNTRILLYAELAQLCVEYA